MPRRVTLVLVSPSGAVVGALPPFEVETPWWMQVGEVVQAARSLHGVEVTVLRLLHADADPGNEYGMGGDVIYLAEVADGVADEPLRAAYARPGGPAAALAWADSVLTRRGTPRVAPAEQLRTWNLSTIWRLPLAEGPAWLKVVPPFFGHEGAVLRLLQASGVVPLLLDSDGGRVLLADVPGEDQYEAPVELLGPMVDALVELQRSWVGRTDALLDVGANDWRPPSFTRMAEDLVARDASALPANEREALDGLVEGLAGRFEALAHCGLPDTLVHGDFHPGNIRSDGKSIVILDWGDSGVGHPLFDLPAFLGRVPAAARDAMSRRWLQRWADAVPGSDPPRAAELIAPMAALRQATVYRMFLDNIEPAERRYHAGDVPTWLSRAAALTTSAQ